MALKIVDFDAEESHRDSYRFPQQQNYASVSSLGYTSRRNNMGSFGIPETQTFGGALQVYYTNQPQKIDVDSKMLYGKPEWHPSSPLAYSSNQVYSTTLSHRQLPDGVSTYGKVNPQFSTQQHGGYQDFGAINVNANAINPMLVGSESYIRGNSYKVIPVIQHSPEQKRAQPLTLQGKVQAALLRNPDSLDTLGVDNFSSRIIPLEQRMPTSPVYSNSNSRATFGAALKSQIVSSPADPKVRSTSSNGPVYKSVDYPRFNYIEIIPENSQNVHVQGQETLVGPVNQGNTQLPASKVEGRADGNRSPKNSLASEGEMEEDSLQREVTAFMNNISKYLNAQGNAKKRALDPVSMSQKLQSLTSLLEKAIEAIKSECTEEVPVQKEVATKPTKPRSPKRVPSPKKESGDSIVNPIISPSIGESLCDSRRGNMSFHSFNSKDMIPPPASWSRLLYEDLRSSLLKAVKEESPPRRNEVKMEDKQPISQGDRQSSQKTGKTMKNVETMRKKVLAELQYLDNQLMSLDAPQTDRARKGRIEDTLGSRDALENANEPRLTAQCSNECKTHTYPYFKRTSKTPEKEDLVKKPKEGEVTMVAKPKRTK